MSEHGTERNEKKISMFSVPLRSVGKNKTTVLLNLKLGLLTFWTVVLSAGFGGRIPSGHKGWRWHSWGHF